MSGLIQLLGTLPLAGLMLVVAAGFLLGHVRVAGISLGPSGATLLIALGLGSAGLDLTGLYGTTLHGVTLGGFGFALYIYSIGFEAGPGVLNRRTLSATWRFVAVGIAVNLVAFAVAIVGSRLLDLAPEAAAGLLAGALTSPPTYAAAAEAADDQTLLAVVFAFTYPLGLTGIVFLVHLLPRWMGDDLAEDTEEPETEFVRQPVGPELRRVFDVTREDAVGRSLAELDLGRRTGCVVTRLHRGHEFTVPGGETVLQRGDHLMAKGRLEELQAFEALIGPEIYDDELRRKVPSPRSIQVSVPEVVGRSLRDLGLVQRFGCVVTEVHRRGVVLDAGPELRLERGDVVMVTGRRVDVRRVADLLGRFERSTNETDISVYAGGILLGLLLGELHFGDGGFRLGTAVGLLIVGLLLGRFRRVGGLSAHVPVAAQQLVRDLGILLFVAETGVAAGHGSWSAIRPIFWETMSLAAVTLVLPVLVAVMLGRRLLALRPADTWGSVGGGLTSSSALVAVRNAADSNEPSTSYAAAYAIASVLATLAGRIVMFVL